MKKGPSLVVGKILAVAITIISTFSVSETHAELVTGQGCGKVFGLVIQGDTRDDFKVDADNMAAIIGTSLKGTVREYRPPTKAEGTVDAPAEIRGSLSELNTGMGPDGTLIVSIHTHGLTPKSGVEIGTGELGMDQGWEENGDAIEKPWKPYEELPWQEIGAGRILINIDTCYAEAAALDLKELLSGPEFRDKEILVLAATAKDEMGGAGSVGAGDRPGGFFTNALIDEMNERGIKSLASPALVAAAFGEIATRANETSIDAKWNSNYSEKRIGISPKSFPINIDVIESISPKSTTQGNEVAISGRHFGYPLPEGEYVTDPNEDIQVSFCQSETSESPQPCYRGLVAEIVRRTNTQIVVKVPDDMDTALNNDLPTYVCINENGKLTSSMPLGLEGRFTLQDPPEISAISPDLVLNGNYFAVAGKNFGDNSLAVIDDFFTINPSWVDDDSMLVHLPSPNTVGWDDGQHALKVRVGTAESESASFTVVSQYPPGDELPVGWHIAVTELTMSDVADGEISLYEAMLMANGSRLPELHDECEETGACEWQQREVDYVAGFFDGAGNARPGGALFKDTIAVPNDLSGQTMSVTGGGLPPVGSGDVIDFNYTVLDGGGGHGLFLDNVSDAEIRYVVLQNFSGDGIHLNQSSGNSFGRVSIDGAGGNGIFIGGDSVQNSFYGWYQDPFGEFKPDIYNTIEHGIYLTSGANRNSFGGIIIADAGASGIFLEGQAEENRFVGMVVTNPALHGLHLSGGLVCFNSFTAPAGGGLSDTEATWQVKDIYERAGGYGILVEGGANTNVLGPAIVYGNALGGIRLDGSGTQYNIVGKGYRAEPYNEGAVLLPIVYENGAMNIPDGHGIHISNGASYNQIEMMNVAGNYGDGVSIEGAETTSNRISGVWTGFVYFFKDATEPIAMPNTGNSVHIANGARWNVIGGHSVSRNNFSNDILNGVLIEGPETQLNSVIHTDIGRTPEVSIIDPEAGRTYDRQFAGVGKSGIAIANGAHDNIIGSRSTDMRVHVDASPDAGILIDGSDDNLVAGCFFGISLVYHEFAETDKNRIGIHIRNGAKGNQIGQVGPMLGPDPNAMSFSGIVDRLNTITETREAGIWIEDAGGGLGPNGEREQPNVLHNNDIDSDGIGLKISGDSRVNDIGGWRGGPTGAIFVGGFFTQEDNGIAGSIAGVQIDSVAIADPAERNRFLNNAIFTYQVDEEDPAGVDLLAGPPHGVGVLITGNSSGNIVGESSMAPNSIGNFRVGVYIDGSHANVIQGNSIGLSFWTPNSIAGVVIRNGQDNRIGGETFDADNIVDGNGYFGSYGMGGPTANPHASGILIVGGQKNTIQGNLVLETGGDGILLIETNGNMLGGPSSLGSNMIVTSSGNGIAIKGNGSSNNVIQRNVIGTDWQGGALGNGADGIDISGGAHGNLIGGRSPITVLGTTFDLEAPNIIAHNAIAGVDVSGPGTVGNSILLNSIHSNAGSGISNTNSGNDELPAPTNMLYGLGVVTGEAADVDTVPAGSVVNAFWDSGSQGEVFLGETTVKTDGTWSLTAILPGPSWPLGYFTATVTHVSSGSTSEFAVASAAWDRAFNVFRADGRAPAQQPVAFGHGDIPVLIVGVIAVQDSVRVDGLTLDAAGSLLDNTQIDGVSIYRDEDRDGRITHVDSLLAGPFSYNSDNGQVNCILPGVVVEANGSQQWIIVYETSEEGEAGTTFSTGLLNAMAVEAEYTSTGEAAVPVGPFPVRSDEFSVFSEVSETEPSLKDVISVLQMMAGMQPTSAIDTTGDINNDGAIGLPEAIHYLEEITGLR